MASTLASVLRARDFRRLYAVRLVGQFSDGMVQAALATFVLFSPEREPDAVRIALAFTILFLPYSIIGPFAGVFLDRWRRRQVLVYANIVRAALVVLLAYVTWLGHDGADLGLIVLVTLGVGRFVLAGLSASLPHVVSGQQLITANALAPTSGTIASAIGAGVGLGIRAIAGGSDVGAVAVLGASIACYVIAAVIARLMDKDLLGPSGDRPSDTLRGVLVGLIDGARSLHQHSAAGRAITVVFIHRITFGALTVVALLLLRNTFNPASDPDAALTEFAIVTAAAAAGGLLGAICAPSVSRRLGIPRWSALVLLQASVLTPVGVFIAAYAVSLPGLLLAGFSLGFAGQSVKVMSDTVVQRDIPDDHLGRVFALFDMIVNVGLVIGITAIAFTTPTSGINAVAYVAVGVLLALTAIWYSRRRSAPRVP